MLSFSTSTLLNNLLLLNFQSNSFRVKRVALDFPVGLTTQKFIRVSEVRCSSRRKRKCKVDGKADFELESEILEFMKCSKNPGFFPSKKELVDAGRIDLVEGIVKKGGWLCLGWDLDEDDAEAEEEEEEEEEGEDIAGNGYLSNSVSSPWRTLEVPEGDVSGIEGILNRLERQRSINFGFSTENSIPIPSSSGPASKGDWLTGTTTNGTVAGLDRSSKSTLLGPDDGEILETGDKLSQNKSLSDIHGLTHSTKLDTWRNWRSQKAGLSHPEFEAAEIIFSEGGIRGAWNSSGDSLQVSKSDPFYDQGKSNSFNEQVCQIQSRLQHLKSELSSVLCTLKSSNNVVTPEDDEGPGEESQQLSDAYEFQENEIMNAQDKLRTLRAKLAVLEGKMALAIIDAQKTVEYKQKRIDDAHRALRLLRTACIVWTDPASEVLLAGSFDGWATQRKMEKSKNGIFSLQLKLYPGQYEIKFIVDGDWRTDPLRPIVNNGGYENNLLIVT